MTRIDELKERCKENPSVPILQDVSTLIALVEAGVGCAGHLEVNHHHTGIDCLQCSMVKAFRDLLAEFEKGGSDEKDGSCENG